MTTSILSAQTADLVVGSTTLRLEDVTVTLDSTRAPYATARFIVPYTAAMASLLDPRTGPRVRITLSQVFGNSQTLADETIQFAGRTLAYETTMFAGMTLADETLLYGTAWNSTVRLSQLRRLDLGVRTRRVTHAGATIEVTAASDEALLTDYALMKPGPQVPNGVTVTDAVKYVLTLAVPGAILAPYGAVMFLPSTASVLWRPGVTAWDYLTPLTAAAGLRLWCDESRVWHLDTPSAIAPPGTVTVSATGQMVDADDTISRDTLAWFDAVVVTYTWTDDAGLSRTAYDIAGPGNATKVLSVEYSNRPYPGPGEAANRLAKVTQMGRVVDTTAVSDFTVTPGQATTLNVPDATLTGWVTGVTWQLPADEMTIATRQITG